MLTNIAEKRGEKFINFKKITDDWNGKNRWKSYTWIGKYKKWWFKMFVQDLPLILEVR